MIDMGQADRSLRDNQRDNPQVFDNFRARLRILDNEYRADAQQVDPRIDGYNPEFLGAKPARAGEDY